MDNKRDEGKVSWCSYITEARAFRVTVKRFSFYINMFSDLLGLDKNGSNP